MHENEDGLTLVEVLVTLLILGIVLSALFSVITGSLRSLSESRARQTASQVATEQIETLRSFSPPEVAMYNDPSDAIGGDFDPSTVTCGTPAMSGMFDPDGPGPIGCEQIIVRTQGAITAGGPWQGPAGPANEVDVTTIATEATGAGVPAGTTRATVVVTYDLPNGAGTERRSALFSEVPRG